MTHFCTLYRVSNHTFEHAKLLLIHYLHTFILYFHFLHTFRKFYTLFDHFFNIFPIFFTLWQILTHFWEFTKILSFHFQHTIIKIKSTLRPPFQISNHTFSHDLKIIFHFRPPKISISTFSHFGITPPPLWHFHLEHAFGAVQKLR